MKIIFDATPMLVNKTGIAYYTERLVVQMAQQYPEVEFVGFYYNFLGRRDSSHLPRAKNLRYTRSSIIPSKIVFQLRRWGIEFPIELLALERADFVLYPNFIAHPSLFKTPSAPVIHDLTYLDLPEYVSAKLRRDLVRFVPRDIRRSSFVVTVSQFTKDRLTQAYNLTPENIVVTPIPPIPAVLHSTEKRKQALLKANITKPFVLFVGTIEPRKNVPNLIDAFLQLPPALRDQHQLVIAGRIGWNCEREVAAIEAATSQGLPVVHLGYVSDELKEILYQSAAVFASASHYEGFGMPVLEAMSYGTPCALSDIPVFQEVAEDAALYFDQEKPADIARVLEKLLSQHTLRTALRRRAKQRVNEYSWPAVATTLFKAIRKAVKAPR